MRNPGIGRALALLVCGMAAASSGCGGSGRPMSAMARFNTVLVVGVSTDTGLRGSYEGSFEVRFSERNVVALSSLPMLQPGQVVDRAAIEGVIRSTGVDAVLVTWLVDPEGGGNEPVPPQPEDLYEHYTEIHDTVRTSGYLQNAELVQLETRLYDAGTGELVITLYSDVLKRGNVEEAIHSVTRTLVERLVEADLF